MAFYIERYGPLALVLPWIAIAYFCKDWMVSNINSGEISLSGLFSAVFGWTSIQTGFIFSVFGFVATKSGGLIENFRRSAYISIFERYVKKAMYSGLLLTVYSIPIMSYKVNVANEIQYWIVVIWFSLFIWAFGAFLRVALNFGKLLSIGNDDEYFPG